LIQKSPHDSAASLAAHKPFDICGLGFDLKLFDKILVGFGRFLTPQI